VFTYLKGNTEDLNSDIPIFPSHQSCLTFELWGYIYRRTSTWGSYISSSTPLPKVPTSLKRRPRGFGNKARVGEDVSTWNTSFPPLHDSKVAKAMPPFSSHLQENKMNPREALSERGNIVRPGWSLQDIQGGDRIASALRTEEAPLSNREALNHQRGRLQATRRKASVSWIRWIES